MYLMEGAGTTEYTFMYPMERVGTTDQTIMYPVDGAGGHHWPNNYVSYGAGGHHWPYNYVSYVFCSVEWLALFCNFTYFSKPTHFCRISFIFRCLILKNPWPRTHGARAAMTYEIPSTSVKIHELFWWLLRTWLFHPFSYFCNCLFNSLN